MFKSIEIWQPSDNRLKRIEAMAMLRTFLAAGKRSAS